MRYLAFALVLSVGLVGTAVAGDYHSGATLKCEQCHVMHGQQSHGYAADGSGTWTAIGGASPYHYLLRNEVNDLCLACHDNSNFVIDVYGESGNGVAGGRQGGALNGNGVANYNDADGHTLWSTDVAPGGSWSNSHGLECTNCHQPHGYGGYLGDGNAYRNLLYVRGGVPGPSVSYAVGTNDLTKDVYEVSASMGGVHYSTNNINFNEPSQTESGYGAWCQGCHTTFHGGKADPDMKDDPVALDEWKRHPTADADIGELGGGHSSDTLFAAHAHRVQVMSGVGDWGTQGTPWLSGFPTDMTPSCFSCHKGHGNKNAFGLIHATGTNPIGEQGDGAAYKDLCKQCHVQG